MFSYYVHRRYHNLREAVKCKIYQLLGLTCSEHYLVWIGSVSSPFAACRPL